MQIAYYYKIAVRAFNVLAQRTNTFLVKLLLKGNNPQPINTGILVDKYTDSTLLKRPFLIVDKNSRPLLQHIIPATYKNLYLHLSFGDVFLTVISPKRKNLPVVTNAFIWGNRWSAGYYHFTAEDLPKLIYAKKTGLPLYTWHTAKIPGWRKQLMEAFNITSNVIDDDMVVKQAFYIANNRVRSNEYNRNIIHPELAGAVMEAVVMYGKNNGITTEKQQKVTWISRKHTQDRHIINEDEHINNLRQAGVAVEVLYPEKLSVKQQIEAVYNTACIIGPHGAGLTNIMFTLHAGIIEIGPERRINNSYISLAASYNRPFRYITARPANKMFKNRSNLILSPDAGILDAVLQMMTR